MRRGDIVIIAQRGLYEGKPRPAVIIQSEALLDHHPSILVCLVAASEEASTGAFYRIPIAPDTGNGLRSASIVQVDKVVTIRRENVGQVIGRLDEAAIDRLNTALSLFQGLS